MEATTFETVPQAASSVGSLHRKIDWRGAFWVASGVPALVLFSIGAIAATVGKPAWIVWIVSILFGFIQAFTYAEIAGLFPHKSGGASVYGAVAWVRYSKLIAPVSVWCNWLAWSPVLSIGSGLAAGYILTALFPADALINTWQLTLLDLGWIKSGLSLRINATFAIGLLILLTVFAVQHGGILRSARLTLVLGVTSLIPLLLVGVVPLFTGDSAQANFLPLYPLAHDAAGQVIDGPWDLSGWSLMAGGLFMAAWSTYGFETAVCCTREFKDPKRDTFKAIFYAGLLCILVFTLVPPGVPRQPGARPTGDTGGAGRQRRSGFSGGLQRPVVARDLQRHGRRPGDGGQYRRRQTGRQHRADHAGPGHLAGDHDVDVRLIAHLVPGVGGRLAAEVPGPHQ